MFRLMSGPRVLLGMPMRQRQQRAALELLRDKRLWLVIPECEQADSSFARCGGRSTGVALTDLHRSSVRTRSTALMIADM